jgi:hypothetical protein
VNKTEFYPNFPIAITKRKLMFRKLTKFSLTNRITEYLRSYGLRSRQHDIDIFRAFLASKYYVDNESVYNEKRSDEYYDTLSKFDADQEITNRTKNSPPTASQKLFLTDIYNEQIEKLLKYTVKIGGQNPYPPARVKVTCDSSHFRSKFQASRTCRS